MTETLPRLIDRMVPAFNRDGTVKDLAHPDPSSVCFLDMAGTLSRIARFNGIPMGLAYSVAQHCVMGTQALINEGVDKPTAALFLLHDGHEWVLGDITRPMEQLLTGMLPTLAVREAINLAKSRWDNVIYRAAGLAVPSEWSAKQKRLVKAMDNRMCAAEAVALFGQRAACQFPKFVTPKTTGAIRPWSASIAEERFITLLSDMISPERIAQQSAIAANARMI